MARVGKDLAKAGGEGRPEKLFFSPPGVPRKNSPPPDTPPEVPHTLGNFWNWFPNLFVDIFSIF